MRNSFQRILAAALLAPALAALPAMAQDTAGQRAFAAVDPFIGTGGEGHTVPGATVPFGMVQLSPDTRIQPRKDAYGWAAGYQRGFVGCLTLVATWGEACTWGPDPQADVELTALPRFTFAGEVRDANGGAALGGRRASGPCRRRSSRTVPVPRCVSIGGPDQWRP